MLPDERWLPPEKIISFLVTPLSHSGLSAVGFSFPSSINHLYADTVSESSPLDRIPKANLPGANQNAEYHNLLTHKSDRNPPPFLF